MGHNTRVPVDVVSIAEGLRQLADLFEKHPAEDAGRTFPTVPQWISIGVESPDAVGVWADLLGATTETHVFPTDVHTRVEARLSGVVVSVTHIGQRPRELRRPVTVTEPGEALEPVGVSGE